MTTTHIRSATPIVIALPGVRMLRPSDCAARSGGAIHAAAGGGEAGGEFGGFGCIHGDSYPATVQFESQLRDGIASGVAHHLSGDVIGGEGGGHVAGNIGGGPEHLHGNLRALSSVEYEAFRRDAVEYVDDDASLETLDLRGLSGGQLEDRHVIYSFSIGGKR